MEQSVLRLEGWSASERIALKATGAAVFAFLTILSAQIRIPLPFTPIPMTLQTFVVPLAGAFLGATWGSVSMLLYLALGITGLNVFAAASPGLGFFLAPSAGYLVGFVLASAFVGLISDRTERPYHLFLALFFSHVIIFTCGVTGLTLNAGMDLQSALQKGLYPFLIGDVIKTAASFVVLLSYFSFRKSTSL
jgi:biotin transport system substrate-specific component